MSIPNIPEVPPNPSNQQLAAIVAQGFQEIFYQMSGFLNSQNIKEVGGWIVGPTRLETKPGVYPRIVFDSNNLELTAYQDADNYFRVAPDAFGSTPGIEMHSILASALIYLLGSSLTLITAAGQAQIQISSGKNLDLFCNVTSGYKTRFDSWSAMLNVATGNTLQQDLDTLTTQGNTNMVDINSLFAYCNSLDMRLTAAGW